MTSKIVIETLTIDKASGEAETIVFKNIAEYDRSYFNDYISSDDLEELGEIQDFEDFGRYVFIVKTYEEFTTGKYANDTYNLAQSMICQDPEESDRLLKFAISEMRKDAA